MIKTKLLAASPIFCINKISYTVTGIAEDENQKYYFTRVHIR